MSWREVPSVVTEEAAHLPKMRHMGRNKKLATPVNKLGKVKREVILEGFTPSEEVE